jgi:RecJ-like exonuclease
MLDEEKIKLLCECFQCDGKGEYEDEVECDCEGCCSGTHYFEADCGEETECPCEKCNETGYIKKIVTCEVCGGTGIKHNFQKVIGRQTTFDNKMIEIRKCLNCGTDEKIIEKERCYNG